MLCDDQDWRPSITIRQLLQGIFEMFDNPNVSEKTEWGKCGVSYAVLDDFYCQTCVLE